MKKSRTKPDDGGDGEFVAFFADQYNNVSPEQSAIDRRKREKSMRTPHGDGRSAKFTGRTEQLNVLVKPALKTRLKAAAKKADVSITVAIELAIEAWLTSEGAKS